MLLFSLILGQDNRKKGEVHLIRHFERERKRRVIGMKILLVLFYIVMLKIGRRKAY